MIHIVKEQTVIDSHKPDIVSDDAGLGLWTDQARRGCQRGNRKVGGAKRDRTADLLRARQALSQLSYGPFQETHETYFSFITLNLFKTRRKVTTYSRSEEHTSELRHAATSYAF